MTPARWSWNRRDVSLGDLPAAAIEVFGVGELLDPAAQLVRLSPGAAASLSLSSSTSESVATSFPCTRR
jgi:hypothetical protein